MKVKLLEILRCPVCASTFQMEDAEPDAQGDIAPFARGSLQYAMSIGVLHHTPDTRRAFRESQTWWHRAAIS